MAENPLEEIEDMIATWLEDYHDEAPTGGTARLELALSLIQNLIV